MRRIQHMRILQCFSNCFGAGCICLLVACLQDTTPRLVTCVLKQWEDVHPFSSEALRWPGLGAAGGTRPHRWSHVGAPSVGPLAREGGWNPGQQRTPSTETPGGPPCVSGELGRERSCSREARKMSWPRGGGCWSRLTLIRHMGREMNG